jgi:tRNA wybutosine-synthesizing protein 1
MVYAKLSKEQKELFVRQHYGLAGEHSAVKICGWTKKSLHDKGVCYKEKFYGICCHRCMQCTPVVNWCTQNCEFCWRIGRYSHGKLTGWEKPKEIVDKMIAAQRKLLTGFPGGNCNVKKWKEAQMPSQVAISLAGEPTIYPKLGELIAEFHKRGMTTFLVTNGTFPEKLAKLNPLPTQLYVTVAAPDKETYLKLCKPSIPNGWEKLNKTLELLPKLKTRKVIRLTLVRGINLNSPEKYAKLIKKAKPDFVEAKAYMAVGFSRARIGMEGMPLHEEIVEFSKKLAKELGWKIIDEQKESRVCLLSKLPKNKIKLVNRT